MTDEVATEVDDSDKAALDVKPAEVVTKEDSKPDPEEHAVAPDPLQEGVEVRSDSDSEDRPEDRS